MTALENPEKRQHLMRFFKTGEGQYGEGDQFLGLTTPQTRSFVKAARDLRFPDIQSLLYSPWHEVRLCGLLILVCQFEREATEARRQSPDSIMRRDKIACFYLDHCQQANNWDLVDLSCYKILGAWLTLPSGHTLLSRMEKIDALAFSDNLWKQRISMVSTFGTLKAGDPTLTLRYAEIHLHHPHDLMHKAVGWMLREMGKRCGLQCLRDFLESNASEMPRTALRYAIEHLPPAERQFWMHR